MALARPSRDDGPRVSCSFLVVTIFSNLKLKFQNKSRQTGLLIFSRARGGPDGAGVAALAWRRSLASAERNERLARWSSFAEARSWKPARSPAAAVGAAASRACAAAARRASCDGSGGHKINIKIGKIGFSLITDLLKSVIRVLLVSIR